MSEPGPGYLGEPKRPLWSWDAATVIARRPRPCPSDLAHGPMVTRMYRVGPFVQPPENRAARTAHNHEVMTRPHLRWLCMVDGCGYQEVVEIAPPLPPREERGLGSGSSGGSETGL